MLSQTIKASQLVNTDKAENIGLGDEVSYKEGNQIIKGEVIGCYENANKFEVSL